MYGIVTVLISCVLISCREDSQVAENKYITVMELIDSTMFPFQGSTPYIVDVSSDLSSYLAIHADYETVSVWSADGILEHKVKLVGDGPNMVGAINKLGFATDSSFAVQDRSRIVEYDFTGTIISATPINKSLSFPYPVRAAQIKKAGDKYITAAVDDNYDSTTPEFFQNSHGISCFDSDEVSNLAFFESTSNYNDAVYPAYFQPVFTMYKDSIYFVRPFDLDRLHITDCMNLSPLVIPIELDQNYSLKPPSGVALSDQLRIGQENPRFTSIVVGEEMIILQHFEALADENLQNDVVQLNERPFLRTSFLTVLDKLTKVKKMRDITLPSSVFKPLHFDYEGKLVCIKKYNYDSETTTLFRFDI